MPPTETPRRATAATRALTAVSVAGLLFSFGAAFVAYWPGSYTPDSADSLSQALARRFNDHHPPVMAGLWRLLLDATGTPASLLVFHQVLFAAGLASLFVFLVRRRAYVLLPALATVPLLPVIVNFSGVVWKDVGCAFALLLASGLAALDLAPGVARVRFGVVWAACAYAVGVRWNALPAVVPILLLAAWNVRGGAPARRPWLRLGAIGAGATVACAVAVVALTYGALRSIRNDQSWLVQLFDLSGIAHQTGDPTVVPRFAFEPPEPTRLSVDEGYVQSVTNGSALYLFMRIERDPPLRAPRSSEERAAIAAAWRNAILARPAAYVAHRASMYGQLLRVGQPVGYYHYVLPPRPEDVEALPFASYGPTGQEVRALLLRDHQRALPGSGAARKLVNRVIARTNATAVFLGWPWLLAEIAVAAVAAALVRSAPIAGRAALAVALSGILYAAALFVLIPACDYRYLYWPVLSTLAAALATAAAGVDSIVTRRE